MIAVPFSRRARPWVIAGLILFAAWVVLGRWVNSDAKAHSDLAKAFIERHTEDIGRGDVTALEPLFVPGALPDNTAAIEGRIKGWSVLGAVKEIGPLTQVDYSWQSNRGYETEGRYHVPVTFAAGKVDVYWTLVTKKGGSLGIWDVTLGAPSELQ